MVGYSNGSVRDLRKGVVSFARWQHENEQQKAEAAYFAEGIENGFLEFPPAMTVEPVGPEAGRYDDVLQLHSISAWRWATSGTTAHRGNFH